MYMYTVCIQFLYVYVYRNLLSNIYFLYHIGFPYFNFKIKIFTPELNSNIKYSNIIYNFFNIQKFSILKNIYKYNF